MASLITYGPHARGSKRFNVIRLTRVGDYAGKKECCYELYIEQHQKNQFRLVRIELLFDLGPALCFGCKNIAKLKKYPNMDTLRKFPELQNTRKFRKCLLHLCENCIDEINEKLAALDNRYEILSNLCKQPEFIVIHERYGLNIPYTNSKPMDIPEYLWITKYLEDNKIGLFKYINKDLFLAEVKNSIDDAWGLRRYRHFDIPRNLNFFLAREFSYDDPDIVIGDYPITYGRFLDLIKDYKNIIIVHIATRYSSKRSGPYPAAHYNTIYNFLVEFKKNRDAWCRRWGNGNITYVIKYIIIGASFTEARGHGEASFRSFYPDTDMFRWSTNWFCGTIKAEIEKLEMWESEAMSRRVITVYPSMDSSTLSNVESAHYIDKLQSRRVGDIGSYPLKAVDLKNMEVLVLRSGLEASVWDKTSGYPLIFNVNEWKGTVISTM